MCLIIHRVSGSNVPNDVIEYNRRKNPDGFGLAWRQGGKVHSVKYGPKNFDGFKAKLKELDRQAGIEYTAHFRMATHGPACEDLSHPFTYEDKKHGTIAVFHNGIIDIDTDRKVDSDTSTFVREVLSKMGSGWWKNSAYRYLVEQAIGYSRLLIMTPTETIRLNEDAWVKSGGIMYSTDPGGSHSKYRSFPPMHVAAPGKFASPATVAASKPGSVVKYTPPKEWLRPEVRSDDSCDYGYIDAGDDGFPVQTWQHEGHTVESISSEVLSKGSEDMAVEAVCSECNTLGEVYIIGGTTFIDIEHEHVLRYDEDEDEMTAAEIFDYQFAN